MVLSRQYDPDVPGQAYRPNFFDLRVVTQAACSDCGRTRQLRGRPQRCSSCYSRAARAKKKEA